MSRHTLSQDVSWIAQRWKAVATFVGTVATVLVIVWPSSHILQLIIGLVGALVTTGVVHQVPNAGTAPVQKVVDEVLKVVPTSVVPAVAQAVTATTTGVLATATATADATLGVVTDTVGGVLGDVGGLLGKKPGDTPD